MKLVEAKKNLQQLLVRAGPPGILLADLKEKYEAFAEQELDYDALGVKNLWELLEYWKDFVKITQEVTMTYALRYTVRARRYFSSQLPQMPVLGRQDSYVIDSDDECYFSCQESSDSFIWIFHLKKLIMYLNWKYINKLQLRQIEYNGIFIFIVTWKLGSVTGNLAHIQCFPSLFLLNRKYEQISMSIFDFISISTKKILQLYGWLELDFLQLSIMMLESAKKTQQTFLAELALISPSNFFKQKNAESAKIHKSERKGTIDVTTSLSPLKSLSAFVIAPGISSSNVTWKVWHHGDVLVKFIYLIL